MTRWPANQPRYGRQVPVSPQTLIRLRAADTERRRARGERPKTHLEVRMGEKYGYWAIVSGSTGCHGKAVCRCVCGETRLVNVDALLRGRTSSCGCRNSEVREAHRAKVVT